MYLGSWKIDDALTFTCNTHRASTGAAADADAVPTYRVYEDEAGTAILSGSLAKLDDANTTGYYSEQITLSAASGFEKGKTYTIYISATVDSVEGTMSHSFQLEAEVDAQTVSDSTLVSNVADILTDTGTTLDGKIDTIDGIVDTILVDTGTTLDGKVDAIQAVTDNLPDSGALTAMLADIAAILVDTGTTLDGKIDTIDGIVDTILVDTAELQTDWTNGGRLDLLIDGIKAVTDVIPDSGALTALLADIASILTDTGTTLNTKIDTIDTVVDAVKAVTDNLPNSGALTDLATGYHTKASGGYDTNDVYVFHAALYKDNAIQNATACTMDLYLYEGTEKKDNAAWDSGPTENADYSWYATITDASAELEAGKAYKVRMVFTAGGQDYADDYYFNA